MSAKLRRDICKSLRGLGRNQLYAEVHRLMLAAWEQGNLAGCDETMSCGYSPERALGLGEWAKIPRASSKHYDIRVPPKGWRPA